LPPVNDSFSEGLKLDTRFTKVYEVILGIPAFMIAALVSIDTGIISP